MPGQGPALERFWIKTSLRKIHYELDRRAFVDAFSVADSLLWLYPDRPDIHRELSDEFLGGINRFLHVDDLSAVDRIVDHCSSLPQLATRFLEFRTRAAATSSIPEPPREITTPTL